MHVHQAAPGRDTRQVAERHAGAGAMRSVRTKLPHVPIRIWWFLCRMLSSDDIRSGTSGTNRHACLRS